MNDASSVEWFARAARSIPGGVNSPVRAFRAVGGVPRFIDSAQGPYIRDVDGNEYVDLVGSWGPMLLGHAHPEVLAAVADAAARGTSFGAPTTAEVELAELIVQRTPVEQVRLVNSGTEATMSALRLARAATGRTKVVKFAGCYHGHVDSLLVAAGSGLATLSVPGSPGVPEATVADTLVVEYNDRDGLRQVFAEHRDEIACIITEAVPGNMGVVAPGVQPGLDGQPEHFNAFLLHLAHEHGALLISDEVMTGFRVSQRGQFGVDQVVPDLMTFGKVMGGGFPAAAFGGPAEIMSLLSPVGSVYQAGTLSGNPVASVAGATTLRLATAEVYDHLARQSNVLIEAVHRACDAFGIGHVINTAGSMFSLFLEPDGDVVANYRQASTLSTAAYAAFFHAMLSRGVYLPPSGYECWFLSAAHDDAAMERIVDALPGAAAAARGALS